MIVIVEKVDQKHYYVSYIILIDKIYCKYAYNLSLLLKNDEYNEYMNVISFHNINMVDHRLLCIFFYRFCLSFNYYK